MSIICNLLNSDLDELIKYLTNKNITKLDFRDVNIGMLNIQKLGQLLMISPILQEIDLTSHNIGDEGAIFLAKGLEHNYSLVTLYLEGNNIGPIGAKAIGKALNKNITLNKLILNWNPIQDEGLEYLMLGLKNNHSLDILGLAKANITGKGAEYISTLLQFNTKLSMLILRSNILGKEGFIHILEGLKYNTSLTGIVYTYIKKSHDEYDDYMAVAKRTEINRHNKRINNTTLIDILQKYGETKKNQKLRKNKYFFLI